MTDDHPHPPERLVPGQAQCEQKAPHREAEEEVLRAAIQSLWRTRRYDTADIAKKLGLTEAEVYNLKA